MGNNMETPKFMPADIFFVMHHDNKLSEIIRDAMDPKFPYSHSGLVSEHTDKRIYTIETSDREVCYGNLQKYIDDPHVSIKVFRFPQLSDQDRARVNDNADKLIQTGYGYLQLISLGIRALFRKVGIKIKNFIRQGLVCCHVCFYGYLGSPIECLTSVDPEEMDTKDLYDLVSVVPGVQTVYEKIGTP